MTWRAEPFPAGMAGATMKRDSDRGLMFDRRLNYVVAISRYGSFTAAAEQVGQRDATKSAAEPPARGVAARQHAECIALSLGALASRRHSRRSAEGRQMVSWKRSYARAHMTEPGGADPRSKGWESLPPWLTRGLALLVGIGLIGELEA